MITRPRTIALVGDYSPAVVAHQAIPAALKLAARDCGAEIAWIWINTRDIRQADRDLAAFAAVWVVPASPYENVDGALDAIRWARQSGRPFLGTCGGFQHALIEFARDVLGIASADHAETNPRGSDLVVTALACSLDRPGPIRFAAGSRLQRFYGCDSAEEGYRCNYGPSATHRRAFEAAGFRFTAHDDVGEPRAAELAEALHPFFIGTLFQPERAALQGVTPPVVRALVQAMLASPS